MGCIASQRDPISGCSNASAKARRARVRCRYGPVCWAGTQTSRGIGSKSDRIDLAVAEHLPPIFLRIARRFSRKDSCRSRPRAPARRSSSVARRYRRTSRWRSASIWASAMVALKVAALVGVGSAPPVHTHPGSETFYVMSGELSQKAPEGVSRISAGQSMPGHPPNTPMQVSSSGTSDLSALVMFVNDATKPFSSPATVP